MNNLSSAFISVYKESYNAQYVLVIIPNEWRKSLIIITLLKAVFWDLSKSFDCIPHDLVIAKLSTFGFGVDT